MIVVTLYQRIRIAGRTIMRRRKFLKQTVAAGLAAFTLPIASSTGRETLRRSGERKLTQSIPLDDPVERFEMRVARDLVPLFGDRDKHEMLDRIGALRCDLEEYGIRMPLIRIRDFAYLADNQYQILIRGRVVGSRAVQPIGDSPESDNLAKTIMHPHDAMLAELERIVRRRAHELADRPSVPQDSPVIISHDSSDVIVN
jgi:hypothetical protein